MRGSELVPRLISNVSGLRLHIPSVHGAASFVSDSVWLPMAQDATRGPHGSADSESSPQRLVTSG